MKQALVSLFVHLYFRLLRLPQSGWWMGANALGWGLLGQITMSNSLAHSGYSLRAFCQLA